jgi:small subunit ribosomal protein S6
MPSYETLCIFHPELPEPRVKELAAWMQKLVENGQGNVLKVEEWGTRDLAYRIKKQRRGHFVRLEYDSEPAALKELERNLRLNEDVLRYISVVREDQLPAAAPTAISASLPSPASAPVEETSEVQ